MTKPETDYVRKLVEADVKAAGEVHLLSLQAVCKTIAHVGRRL